MKIAVLCAAVFVMGAAGLAVSPSAGAAPAGPEVQVTLDANVDPGTFATNALPHGYDSAARLDVSNPGAAVPAGAELNLTFSPGFALGDEGVHWDVTEGDAGTKLSCTQTGAAVACTLPKIAAKTEVVYAEVSVRPAVTTPVGTKGTLKIEIPGAPFGDTDTSNNGIVDHFTSGPVAHLRSTMTVDKKTVAVGGTARITATVVNQGPDTAKGRVVFLDTEDFGTAARVHVTAPGGSVHKISSGRYDIDVPILKRGEKFTLHADVTPTRPRKAHTAYINDDSPAGFTFDPDPECIDGVQCLRQEVRVAFVAATDDSAAGPATGVLATTGSDTGFIALLGGVLVASGALVLGLGRRRRCSLHAR